jgi:hypothetical protein
MAGAERFSKEEEGVEVLYTEVAGTVPIMEGVDLTFRVDAIMADKRRGIFVKEHKTGSRLTQTWADQWQLKVQVGTYVHLLYCMYPAKDVYGAIISGTFFYKSKEPEFISVPVRKTPEQMQVWLWNVREQVTSILREMDRLDKVKEDDLIMEAFPMNTESCTKYYGCPFQHLCVGWANPTKHCDTPPIGIQVEWWNPRDEETQARKVVHL